MTLIPEPEVNLGTVAEWFRKKKDLIALQASEMLLRKRIFTHFFKAPKEGSGNWYTLDDGYRLNGVHKINRSVDEPVMRAMWDDLCKQGVPMNNLIRMKPELNTKAYRELTEEQRKLFDQCLTIKDGSPELDIKPPKAAK
jgi:hypothetical protein